MFLNTMFLFSVAKVRRISNTHQKKKKKNVNFCFFIDLNQKPEAHKGSFWDKCLLFRNCCNNILRLSANAEFSTPDSYAATYIIMGYTSLI